MADLRELLDRRAGLVESTTGALEGVHARVRRRRIRRRVATASGTVLVLALVLVAEVPDAGRPVGPLMADQFLGPAQAKQVRTALGILGPTKGASGAVIVQSRNPQGHVDVSLVHVASGTATPLPLEDAHAASVSPTGDTVAAVTEGHDVVVVNSHSGVQTSVGRSHTGDGPVSWDRAGTTMFALVNDEWVRFSNPGRRGTQVRTLQVPRIPGGPVALSISPSGDTALLFGLEFPPGNGPQPRLFIGDFDGTAVTSPREIEIPTGATDGPMGWVGDNAFLLTSGPGTALIVRTDGRAVPVRARGIPSPCRLAARPGPCRAAGPNLLGTNGDGSLLFWRIAAVRADGHASGTARLVFYFRTWLDGSHALQLMGPAARYGPPLAAR